jgi:osmotically-inducible protein OsmY
VSNDRDITADQRIAEAVEQALAANPWLADYPITVAAVGSTVTLTGHVPSQDAKDTVIQMARKVDGVIDVNDDLVIGGEHPVADWFFPWRNRNEDIQQERGEW